jgi:hypothetical protein
MVDHEHSPIGQLHLGRFDGVPQDIVVRRLTARFCRCSEHRILFRGESQAQPSGLGSHADIVHQMTYKPRKRRQDKKAVLILVANRDIRIMTPDGTLIRRLTLDPKRIYQPLGT